MAPIEKTRELTAQLLWTAFVLLFFVVQGILWTVAISVTAGDSSHAVVAGYDEQALQWDEVKKLQQASDRLGWKAEIMVDATGDVRGDHKVSVTLSKESNETGGKDIEGVEVELTAFHRARAADPQTLTLEEITPGTYQGVLKVQHSGIWQFSGTASTANDKFLFEQKMNLKSNRNL